jgi:hypothetical protein
VNFLTHKYFHGIKTINSKIRKIVKYKKMHWNHRNLKITAGEIAKKY